MRLLRLMLVGSIVCIFLTSCAAKQKSLFVLLPNPDGKPSSIIVTTKDGSQTLSTPRQATVVIGTSAAPSEPAPMEEGEIAKIFGPALAAQKEFPSWLLYFELNSTSLTRASQEAMKEIIATVKSLKSIDISVVGHTDRLGTRQKNYTLSVERAVKVRNILVSQGVDPRIIQANGYGEDMPLIQTEDEVPEPRNRRAEVKVR
jgi:outer membrane protein OmpA-like peptidoglycan-associated protein